MNIICDIDGVLADLATEWIRRYNCDYDDTLTVDSIHDWDTHLFVKSECGLRIYEYIQDPKIYDNVIPIKDSLEGISKLRTTGANIIFATSFVPGFSYYKFSWLQRNGFDPSKKYYIETWNKSLISGHVLIDDSFRNVSQFNGVGVLFNAPWNIKYEYDQRITTWRHLIDSW